ncbi:MAG: enoyl-CoA hydratase/isomerase family protein [Chloroflexi bacterium]|nr:enoyl-CoA hydratase/isomerase family protein [Chloroflexota bacterium]
MAEHKEIRLEKKDGVAWITLDNPPVNVLTIKNMGEMCQALESAKADPEVKVAVITNAGDRAFSTGISIKEHAPGSMVKMLEALKALEATIHRLDKPCIVAVNGYCLGGALELVLAADMAIASEKSTFGQPEIKVGQMAISAVAAMPPVIGRARTMELVLGGDRISARQVEAWGLINKVVPADKFQEEVESFVKRFTVNSGILLSLTRKAIHLAYGRSAEEAQRETDRIYQEIRQTEDYVEGIEAFRTKRPPQWKNR